MPTSDPRVISGACREIFLMNPKTVLDIGVGFGKWGVMSREYTDIWNQRFYPNEWLTTIIGVEVHPKYSNPVWDVYSRILIGEASKVLKGICAGDYDREDPKDIDSCIIPPKNYDLAIMIDVLEHFEKEQGQKFLDLVMGMCDNFLVSYCNSEQKDVRDNKYEDHLSIWSDEDFIRFDRKLVVGEADWAVYLLSKG